jgi:hypothetical protein
VDTEVASGVVGRGISIEGSVDAAEFVPGSVVVRGSVVERAHETGLAVVAATASIESTLVRAIDPRPDGVMGRGIGAEVDPLTGTAADLQLVNTLVERCHEFGVFVTGSRVSIERSTVRDIFARPSDGAGGVGIAIQMSFETGAPSEATIADSLVERTQQSGLSVIGATANIFDVVVRDSLPDDNGAFGDGVLAVAAFYDGQVVPTTVHLESSLVENSARAGLLSFATTVRLKDDQFECNTIDLNGEPFEGIAFVIEDLGGNVCGCNGTSSACKVLSTHLEVPDPIH